MSAIGPDISRSLLALRHYNSDPLQLCRDGEEPKKGGQGLYRIKSFNTDWEVRTVRMDTMVIKLVVVEIVVVVIIKDGDERGELNNKRIRYRTDWGKKEL